MPDIHVPSNATFDRLNEIIIGWYRAKAHEMPVAVAEIEKRTGVPYSEVSRQNAFLQDAGFLQKEGKGLKLTPTGVKYAKYLDYGQLEDAKRVLTEIFLAWDNFQPLFDYIDIQGPLQQDDLINRIALAAEKKPVGGGRTGIVALINLLLFSGLVVEMEDGFVTDREVLQRPPSQPVVTETELGRHTEEPTRRLAVPVEMPFSLQLQLVFDSSLDSAKLKEVLQVIRAVLMEEEE